MCFTLSAAEKSVETILGHFSSDRKAIDIFECARRSAQSGREEFARLMDTKLLIPLGGSRLAEGVLPYARLLAHGLNVPVELLRVNDPAESGSYLAPIHRDEYFEKIATRIWLGEWVNGMGRYHRVSELGAPKCGAF
jgi:hypothetical protein